mmetsp:Transcript_98915/g.318948  ORF Transcript_98915/g.318948 Transcript_98915/m.318948 type:complete len:414 (+) Transcript_98915:204-1445(+)
MWGLRHRVSNMRHRGERARARARKYYKGHKSKVVHEGQPPRKTKYTGRASRSSGDCASVPHDPANTLAARASNAALADGATVAAGAAAGALCIGGDALGLRLEHDHIFAIILAGQVIDVRDVIPRVPIKRLLQSQLVDVMGDEAGGTAEDEQTVQATEGQEVLNLVGREGAARADHVHEAHGDATVHVQDQVRPLAGGDLLHPTREVQDGCASEVLLGEVLDDDHALVGIRQRLDSVPDAHDELVVLLATLHEALRRHARIVRFLKHPGRIIQSSAEAGTDGQQTRDEGRNEVLAGAGRHDGVVGSAHRWAVVRSDHQDHLDELAAGLREALPEPEQGEHAADAQVLAEDVRDRHAAVLELLATVVGDGGDEVGGLADQSQLLGPSVVQRHCGRHFLGLLHDGSLHNHLRVHL